MTKRTIGATAATAGASPDTLRAQRMGLRLGEIRELLDIRDRGACPCGHTRQLLQQRLADIDQQRRRLDTLRRDLTTMLTGLNDCTDTPLGTWWCETEFTKKGGEPP